MDGIVTVVLVCLNSLISLPIQDNAAEKEISST